VRLAVTGLSGAGKTMFIVSTIHNLLAAPENRGLLPFFDPQARNALIATKIGESPNLARPQFAYADHLRRLSAAPPAWPESTRDISEIRLSIRYRVASPVGRLLGDRATLNLDIIDYPGEWLLDLPLLEKSFAEWSTEMWRLAALPPRDALSREWRAFVADHPAGGPASDETARHAASLYTDYLHRCRAPEHDLSLVQPGRFVLPGEHAGAPILWFCPLSGERPRSARDTLYAQMERRYDAYRREIVRRFYRQHFRTFDRQIVLVDVLKALDTGPHSFADAQRALSAVLDSFRFGQRSWLRSLLGDHIDRVLLGATKADHVVPSQYGNLASLLAEMMAPAAVDVKFAGSAIAARALASIRSTRLGIAVHNGRKVEALQGTPIGETEPRIMAPGEVPAAPPSPEHWAAPPAVYPRFQPPQVAVTSAAGIPHIGLDAALDYLIGDKFR
jgi:predicted YcjX-like family ATPase